MLLNDRAKLSSILQKISDNLDIPGYAYEDATLKYEDVAEHLAAEDSDLFSYEPSIYVQGSFRLGTMVQPCGREDEYDIDLVCQLKITKDSITQTELKSKIGKRLKVRDDLANILEESRRCWLLDYPSKEGLPSFHMDVLPSIQNQEQLPTGILLTDTELVRWQKSNPIAYAEWFKTRMEVAFRITKTALAKDAIANIEDVPDWRVKTPLQRCIQILKRHRDVHFANKSDVKPVSIILTTLAAHSYQNEVNIFDALRGITRNMPSYIENRDGVWWVQNPVERSENFADKWNEYPERRIAFTAWLKKVEADFSSLSQAETVADGLARLDESIGRQTMEKVSVDLGLRRPIQVPATVPVGTMVPALADASHAVSPHSKFSMAIQPQYFVKVSPNVYFKKKNNKGRYLWPLGQTVPKNIWIKFAAKTNFPESHSVKWQVVNTGQEAINDDSPRGEFYDSDESDDHVRWESTSYRGTHWVEAFVINNIGACVARSGKIYVRVR